MMDFYQRVALVCRQIPAGKVATYGQIALLCQAPSHARQVGFALHHRLEGQAVPAHRVVNGKGYLTGAMAFSFSREQSLLLQAEGVQVGADNRVDLKIYGWVTTLQFALDLEALFLA